MIRRSAQFGTDARRDQSICHSARCRVVVLDGECAVGPPQSRHRLSACVPGWELRTAQDPARTPSCGGHLGHVAHACSHLRPLLWRSVSLFDWPGTQLPAAKRGSELRGSEIVAYVGALIQLSRFVKDVVAEARRERTLQFALLPFCPVGHCDSVAIGIGKRACRKSI